MSGEALSMRNVTNSDFVNNNFSTHETAYQTPDQLTESQMTTQYQFSHLFPAHLYVNRDLTSNSN
jgi:hypothetical protein